jgi:hypothetical protein
MASSGRKLQSVASWSQQEAIALCREIEGVCPEFGCHVALTGGCLYKDGFRKDLDLLFYRIRQEPLIDQDGLFAKLEGLFGLKFERGFGWCFKLKDRFGRTIDCFFPEEQGGEYADSDEEEEVAF